MRTSLQRHSAVVVLSGLLLLGGGRLAMAGDVAMTLEQNPNFSNFVATIKATGLWEILKREKAVTIFAPTNDAYAKLGDSWRQVLVPPTGGADFAPDQVLYQRQVMVKSASVSGVHPHASFAGKVTRVKSLGGTVFLVDGTKGADLVINPMPSLENAIGFPQEQTTVTATAPVATDNGLIYPTNGFTLD